MTRVEWSGYVDTARLVPRKADPRYFWGPFGAPETALLSTPNETLGVSDTWQYGRTRVGYRLIAGFNLQGGR